MQMLANTAGTIGSRKSPGIDEPDLHAEHRTCFWLVDELNDVLLDQRSKQYVQDQVLRLLASVTTHFRHEDGLFSQYGYLDGPRHSERHSEILAKYQKLSDKLNNALLPAVWIECGSHIGRMLEDHLEEERVIYGT